MTQTYPSLQLSALPSSFLSSLSITITTRLLLFGSKDTLLLQNTPTKVPTGHGSFPLPEYTRNCSGHALRSSLGTIKGIALYIEARRVDAGYSLCLTGSIAANVH